MKPAKNRHFKVSTMALSVAAALFSTNATQAQQAQEGLEEIQITGTRIRTTDGMVQPTPVTAVTTAEMQNFDPSSSVSEQLDNLPQFLNTQTAQRGGGTLVGDAAGSYLNLRNMGKQRTLVLFDGSRVVPADRSSTVNVDNFPTALIRTVDVVTGGASAAYGADALAGVVNFVLDREFQGLKTSVSTGVTEVGDGQNWNFSVAGGKQIGDRLNVIGSIEAREINQIYRKPQDLDNYASWGWVTNPAWRASDPAGTNPQRLTVPHAHHALQNAAGIITTSPGTSAAITNQFRLQGYTFTDDGTAMRPFVRGDYVNRGNSMQAGGPEAAIAEQAFDLGGVLGAEVVQRSGFGAVKYDISDTTNIFGQVMIGRTESNTHDRRGNPEMGNPYFGTIYRENPFLPAALAAEMDRLGLTQIRIDKIGQLRGPGITNFYDGRSDSNISQMWSTSAGFETELPNTWVLRGTYQYGESKLTSEAENVARIDHWYMAMDAVRHPVTGAIMCNVQLRNPSAAELAAAAQGRLVPTTNQLDFPTQLRPVDGILPTPEESIRDCQPMNVFGIGNVSTEAAEYIMSDDKKGIRDLDQHFAEMLLTGEVHEGWGAGPLSFAAGLTYREEWFNQFTRPIPLERGPLNAPALGIRGIPDAMLGGNRSMHSFTATSWATGEFDVWEWFTELNVPVWESGSGNQRLDSNFAFRQSDYSHSGKVDSWKIGGELQVVEGLRLRVTKSRDVREPTFGEQFEAGGAGTALTDPRFPGTTYTITALNGGNPGLKPEFADTLTAGVVFAPTFADWIEGFQISADWYEIEVEDRVGQLGANRLVAECEAGDAFLCSLVTRNPDNGRVDRLLNMNLNLAASRTAGVDIEARYAIEPDFLGNLQEDMTFRLFAGHMLENSVTTTTYIDEAGSQNNPEWTATAMTSYNFGDFGVSLIGRYYDSTIISQNGILWREGFEVDDNTIASQTVANLVLNYRGETSNGGNWVASLNVSNVFDRDPPIVPSETLRGGQQQVGNMYDVFGRRYQLSLNYNF